MGHSHLSKGIGQLSPRGRAGPCGHVTHTLKGDWLPGRGIATEEGAFPRGLGEAGAVRSGGGPRASWQCRGLASIFTALSDLSQRSRAAAAAPSFGWTRELEKVSAAARPRCSGKPLGTRSGGKSESRGRPRGRGTAAQVCGWEKGLGSGEAPGRGLGGLALGRSRERTRRLSAGSPAEGARRGSWKRMFPL